MIGRYPDEIYTNRTQQHHDEQELRWPQDYKDAKTKIVIHHTASITDFADEAEAMSGVREIYEYHAVKRGW